MYYSGLSVTKSGTFRIHLFFKVLIWVMLFGSAASTDLMAQGNLLVYPRRVVFEGGTRSQDITVANTGNDSAKYAISIVQMRMKEDGSFEQITTPDEGQMFADKYLRFYPRSVFIKSKKSQIVKMQFAKAQNMAPGEYRSHIYFRAIPQAKPLGDKTAVKDSTAVSAKLVPVFGMTIPVIIRVGESDTRVTLTDLQFEMLKDTLPKLKMTFNRSGAFSVFGDITVKYISSQGKETKVATVKAIAVYTPNLVRRFQCSLDRIPGVDYKSGKLKVLFSNTSDTRSPKLAEAELVLH